MVQTAVVARERVLEVTRSTVSLGACIRRARIGVRTEMFSRWFSALLRAGFSNIHGRDVVVKMGAGHWRAYLIGRPAAA